MITGSKQIAQAEEAVPGQILQASLLYAAWPMTIAKEQWPLRLIVRA